MVSIPQDLIEWCRQREMEIVRTGDDIWQAEGRGLTIRHEGERYAVRIRSPQNETLTVIRTSEIEVQGNTLNFHKPETEAALKTLHDVPSSKQEVVKQHEAFKERG